MDVLRGQIYFVSLDPTVGREMSGNKRRPFLVVSINAINRKPLTVLGVPGSSVAPKRRFRNMVAVAPSRLNGLRNTTYFTCHQLRAIDQERFVSEACGWIEQRDLVRIEDSIRFCIGLDGRPSE